MTKINFCGATNDLSGYAEFSRYFIYALHNAGVDVSIEPINVDAKDVDYGKKGILCRRLLKKSNGAKVNVINMIPPLFKRFKRPGNLNIGFTMWEATELPKMWVKLCNEMDAIFVPCHWNKEIFENSGVKVPVYVVQPGIDLEEVPPLNTKKSTDEFKFYSVFQWIERKNPLGLIRAYFSEFSDNDNVSLTLKTYKHARINNNSQLIVDEINALKKDMKIPGDKYPKIHLITNFLSTIEMDALHNSSHCFVLPHRAEGFGMPHMEAMLRGNPVIATNFSGNIDFMNEENSYPIDYQLTPVGGMSWYVPWYDGTMWWGETDLHQMAKTMRYAYENREEAMQKGLKGREYIINNFNNKISAEQFMNAVEDLVSRRGK